MLRRDFDPVVADCHHYYEQLDKEAAIEAHREAQNEQAEKLADVMMVSPLDIEEAFADAYHSETGTKLGQAIVDMWLSKGSLNAAGLRLLALLEDSCKRMALEKLQAYDSYLSHLED